MPEEKVAVITGATRGIGKNTALYFAEKGFRVIGTGRTSEKLEELEKELKKISSSNTTMMMDVRNREEVTKVVAKVIDAYGKIDVWINNAGAFMAIGPTWEVDAEDWLNDVQTNVFGLFHCVQAVVPMMLKQETGRIINLAGGGTVGTFKYGNGYGTSKTAVARFTENLAAELEEYPVHVFALDPGLNDTDMTRYQRESKVGNQYLPHMERLFEENVDVPPYQAPDWAYQLASGELDAFAGRIITVYDDFEERKKKASEGLEKDFLKLRLKK